MRNMEDTVGFNSGHIKPAKRKHPKPSKKIKKLKRKRTAEDISDVGDTIGKSDSGNYDEESMVNASDDNASESEELLKDDNNRHLDFDIEAFPMEPGDRDGIVNMLTQIFLKADIDLGSLADTLIAQSPFGLVIGPADDQSDEDNENVVYGILSVAKLNPIKADSSKYAKDVLKFIEEKSRKFALKEFCNAFESIKTNRTGLFVNERMLNFPTQIVPPSFKSIQADLLNMKKPYQKIVYVHKLRIADSGLESPANKNTDTTPAKKKKKMGKAEKRRLAIQARSQADIIYDNAEDEILTQITEGEAQSFDYQVYSEIESTSKFHTLVKDGKSYKPYRRVVVMDSKRFNAFLEQVINSSF